MRSLVRRLTFRQEGGKKLFVLGLINEDGRPAWEDFPREETHAFRRYVYEKLQCLDRQDRNPAGENLHPFPGPG